MNYIPLKITTEYSLLKSTIKINSLISFLTKEHINSAALVDTNLYGIMDFYTQMTNANLKPIIGLEITLNNQTIYLYAKNYAGYQNLLKIHTLKEFNNLTLDTIQEYLSNIKIVLPFNSYDLLTNLPEAYLSYQNQDEKLIALLNTTKIVYLRDILSLTFEDTAYLKYFEAISKGVLASTITTDYQNNYPEPEISPEDSQTTLNFIADINLEIPFNKNYIPKYNPAVNSQEFLYNLAHKGLRKRLNGEDATYTKRLNYELDVITKMGFVDYFLIVYDYVLYAKKNNILVGPGRGSAAGSLVSYSLGITNVDPLKYNLLFERFLNPERITMPDIDIDFEYTKRGEVINYVRNKYGNFNVAPIMTFGTLGAKQVIRDVARTLDFNLPIIDSFVKLINPKFTLAENIHDPNVASYLRLYPELQKIVSISLKLEGFKRHISTHAAGVVISSVPLDTLIPIINNNDGILTGVTMEYLESLGLLKMDFLALRNLTIIANVLDLIKTSTGKYLDLNKINLNDPEIFNLFQKGDTEGIFQYESSGMRNLMQKLKPTSFSDLVASVALFRPGPMNNIDSFIRRKYHQEPITYLHPSLEPILQETYGIIVYQEQVMQILVTIGGYSYAEADNIRRAMSKKKESVMLKDREHFLTNAKTRGYESHVASAIYDLILKFANYGFNKAHSVSYALIGYQMAYLKTKFPIYFIANLLNMSIGSDLKTQEYLNEAKAKGITILKPDVNISTTAYLIKDNSLMLPLTSIKSLGTSTAQEILNARAQNGPFANFLDFVARIYGKANNKKTILALIDAGVLDSFNLTKKTMAENLDIAINYASLVAHLDASFVEAPELISYPEYSLDQLREKEYATYGFYLQNHPVSKYTHQSFVKNIDVSKHFDQKITNVILIEKIKTVTTKKGETMAFLTGSDETAPLEFVIFPKVIATIPKVAAGDIVKVYGRVTKRYDTYQINVDYLTKI